jgi:hypothetical protein
MPQQTIRLEMGRLRREVAIVAAILGTVTIIAIMATGWVGDRRSCQRQLDIRRALIEQREINRASITFWEKRDEPIIADRLRARVRADSRIQQLDCSGLLPGV